MAFDSAAGLLFNIQADSSDAEETLKQFRARMGDVFDDINAQLGAVTEKSASTAEETKALAAAATESTAALGREAAAAGENAAAIEVVSESHQKARFAAQLLARDLGVTMPRALSSVAAQSTLLAPLLTAAFPAVAALALLPILGQLKDKISSIIDSLGGWDAQTKAQYASIMASNMDLYHSYIQVEMAIKHIKNIGLEGEAANKARLGEVDEQIKLLNHELVVNQKALKDSQQAIQEFNKVSDYAGGFTAASAEMMKSLDQLSERAETAKKEIPGLEAEVQRLTLLIRDFAQVKKPTVIAEIAADANKVKKVKTEFSELSNVLKSVKTDIAGTQGAYAELENKVTGLMDQTDKATAALKKANAEGSITAANFKAQMALLPQIASAVQQFYLDKRQEIDDKAAEKDKERTAKQINTMLELKTRIAQWAEEVKSVHADLEARIDQQQEQTYARQVARLKREIEVLRESLKKKGELTADNEALIQRLQVVSLAKLDHEQQQAYQGELSKLRSQLDKINALHATEEQKIEAQYREEVAKFSQKEERKAQILARSELQQIMIHQQYAAIRKALLTQEQNQLQTLENSTGWRGIFGDVFKKDIEQDQALMKQWASSTNQSLLLVKVALQSAKQMGQQFFQQEAQAMGQSIAQALVYSKSIGQAMQQATASTLEQISAQSAVKAIFALATGFLDLAEQDYPGAEAAFQAAGLFAVLAGGAGLAGRAIAGKQGGSGSGAGSGSGGSGSGGSAGGGSAYGSAPSTQGGVTVNVYGHVYGTSGVEELTGLINEAVQQRDVQLSATQVRQVGGGYGPGGGG